MHFRLNNNTTCTITMRLVAGGLLSASAGGLGPVVAGGLLSASAGGLGPVVAGGLLSASAGGLGPVVAGGATSRWVIGLSSSEWFIILRWRGNFKNKSVLGLL